MGEDWLNILAGLVQKKPLVVFQFQREEWSRLRDSDRGTNEFTIARSHDIMKDVRPPTACLVFGRDYQSEETRFGLVSSRSAVSTLESRIKVSRTRRIYPSSKTDLLQLVTDQPHTGNLRRKLASDGSVIVLSPKLSAHLVEKLAAIETNREPMRAVSAILSEPDVGMASMQDNAVKTALRAFGLPTDGQAISLRLVGDRKTALRRVPIIEDRVIEQDARDVPGYNLTESDITGHAVFQKGDERLDVYTANRGPLEEVFGVDLVYLNTVRQNIVMVQYKMLEPRTGRAIHDWIYRPDDNLDNEIRRMRKFITADAPGQYEYRLNPQVFYLKFVKRDAMAKNASIVMPIDHFTRLRTDPKCKGPRGGFRISFESLGGRYLRHNAFIDLISSGYIGAHVATTACLTELVRLVVQGNRTVVAAIQS